MIFLSRIKKVLNLGTKSITSNGTYSASSDGYDGYSQVTVNVSGGGGTPITPSNASPVALTANTPVTPTAAGYAIESYSSITPSNASPVALTSGDINKMGGAGYAIESYDSKTPDDDTPPTVANGDIVKMGGAGYLYATEQIALAGLNFGTEFSILQTSATINKNSSKTINVSAKPKIIVMFGTYNATQYYVGVHNVENDTGWGTRSDGAVADPPVFQVTSASASQIVIKNNSASYNLYMTVVAI